MRFGVWLSYIQYQMSSASYVPKLAYPHTESMLRRFMRYVVPCIGILR